MYRLLEWAFAYDDGSGLPDAGAYAAELKNVTATADGKPVQGFDPTKTGTWTIPAGTQVNIVDMPDDWKLDGKAEQPAGTVVFTASKYGTPVVTWTFKNDSATDPDKPADPGDDSPSLGYQSKMDSPSPNTPRERSSPSNRSCSACSRSSLSHIS